MTPKLKAATEPHGEPSPTLSQICTEAADHVARARVVLNDESSDADQALLHLDDAILCLRRLWAHGRPANGNGSRTKLRSA
jgi:hypothetical protein